MSVADDKFDDLDFDDLQAAVESSAKGRWFLEEYARRTRAHETGSILEAIAKLERVITTSGPQATPALPEPVLRQHQLKYFKKDEDLFEEAKPAPTVTIVAGDTQSPAPQASEQPAAEVQPVAPDSSTPKQPQIVEHRGARLRIMRNNAAPVIESNGTHALQAAKAPPPIPDLDIPPAPPAAEAKLPVDPQHAEPQPVAAAAPATPMFGERKQRIVISRKPVEQEPVIPLIEEELRPAVIE